MRAFAPITRTVLLVASGYYAFITASHPLYEHGVALAVLASLSAATCLAGIGFWAWLGRGEPRLGLVELWATAMYLLIAANISTYLSFHLQPPKLVYFIFLALVAAGSAPTPRTALVGVVAAMLGLAAFAPRIGPGFVDQYGFLGLAGCAVALGLAMVTRRTILAERRARLRSDALAHEAADASRAKTDFLAAMSHEIRNPLNALMGAAQLLSRDGLSGRQKARVDLVMRSGQALLAILNDLLDLSKIEAGHLELAPAPFALGELAEAARATYEALATGKALRFEVEAAQDYAGDFVGDLGRIRQILHNLISNAVKFTDRGQISVTLRGGPEGLVLSVADTGVGIEPESLARLFERFVQAEAGADRRHGGSGLGLAICRELAEAMGGRIAAESVLGQGSRFTVTLPLPLVEHQADEASVEAPAAALDRPIRVLAAEDDPINRETLGALLEQIGAGVTLVEDGEAALAAFATGGFDLVLLDIQMPGLDGLGAARRIRALEQAEGRPRVPVLAVTANVMSHQLEAYGEAGIDGWVAKPVALAELLGAIVAMVEGRG
ncbi:hybrid sensor histidine kinase/response regulator [Phenylobacterium montanum]|uniref:histidine kinase n=1 Tax=Phenylobacterium montanum TaxID=2823693 RepID=A0A975FVY5_9CAUL|nr:ATP-binding protein [Caulobacter sp. S6]QUD86136.1 response regulator [Caulobacter sp. S6]